MERKQGFRYPAFFVCAHRGGAGAGGDPTPRPDTPTRHPRPDTPTRHPDTPDPTPRHPDTQRVMEGMKTECERNAKGKKSRNASGMQGECNRKSKGAGGRGEGSKGQGGATEPKAQKSLGAKTHATTRDHAETAKASTFCALWRG